MVASIVVSSWIVPLPDNFATFPVANLSDAERRLVDAFIDGENVDLRVGNITIDDPVMASGWGLDRHVRAVVIAAIALGAVAHAPGIRAKLSLNGARIVGALDISNSDVHCPLELTNCFFEEGMLLSEAKTRTIDLTGSLIRGVRAESAEIDGSLILERCRSLIYDLPRCHITGRLAMDGVKLDGSAQYATTDNERHAIVGDGMSVDGGIFMGNGFQALGEVRLIKSSVGGYLGVRGAKFSNIGGAAVAADGISVDGNILFGGGTLVEGELRLIGAHVTGQLAFDIARISNRHGIALNCDFITIDGSLSCSGLMVEGETRLLAATINGEAELSGSALLNSNGIALCADRLTVNGPMACSGRFRAVGETRLLGAHIRGQLLLNAGQFLNEGGFAINADSLKVDGDMFCQYGFLAKGEIRLLSAQISGQLGFVDATLVQPKGEALLCQAAQIGTLWLGSVIISGGLDLTEARVQTLVDAGTLWPRRLSMDRFTYEHLIPDRPITGNKGRLGWLELSDGYRPQPYEQLAAYCRRLGHDRDARRVLLIKNRRHRSSLPRYRRVPGWVWDIVVGYGYQPLRAVIWILAVGTLGVLYFNGHHPAPIDPAHHPRYQPILYVADLMLPVVNLEQSSAWYPSGPGELIAATLTVLGWFFAIAIVAGVTRTLSRN